MPPQADVGVAEPEAHQCGAFPEDQPAGPPDQGGKTDACAPAQPAIEANPPRGEEPGARLRLRVRQDPPDRIISGNAHARCDGGEQLPGEAAKRLARMIVEPLRQAEHDEGPHQQQESRRLAAALEASRGRALHVMLRIALERFGVGRSVAGRDGLCVRSGYRPRG